MKSGTFLTDSSYNYNGSNLTKS